MEAFETEWRVELEGGEGRVRRAVAAGARAGGAQWKVWVPLFTLPSCRLSH